uniref:class I SAM-dependent methyltransferase n=1 Tax=Thermomonas sp. TaxID=1971895 RepID=UPI0026191C9B
GDPDAAVIDPKDSRGHKNAYLAQIRDIAIYESLADAGIRAGTIMDLGCGSGSATLPLLRAGHRVLGLDISAGLLRHAQRRCDGMDCLFVQTDGGLPPLSPGKLDAVIIYGVLCYTIDDNSVKAILARIREALRPDAPLIMIEQVRSRRRLTEGGFKVQRTLGEWHELLDSSGFKIKSATILRHGRFPTTPLIAAGMVPRSAWNTIQKLESAVAAVTGVFPWDYAEVRFVATS